MPFIHAILYIFAIAMQFSNPSVESSHPKSDKDTHIPTSRHMCAWTYIHTRTHTNKHKQTHAVRVKGGSEKCRHGSYGSCAPRGLHLVQSGILLFTHIHTHTCQLHLLLEPTEHCWAKMGLAAESLEDYLDWAHKVWLFELKIFTSLVIIYINSNRRLSYLILKPVSVNL